MIEEELKLRAVIGRKSDLMEKHAYCLSEYLNMKVPEIYQLAKQGKLNVSVSSEIKRPLWLIKDAAKKLRQAEAKLSRYINEPPR